MYNAVKIPSYVDSRKILLTFNPISPILLSKQGDYSVVEKVKPDPLNLLANTNEAISYAVLRLKELLMIWKFYFFITRRKRKCHLWKVF